jgi:cell division septation protein DedD
MDMPLVFGLLVVFNAVFLAWQFFEQQNRGQGIVVVVEEQEGKPLQLLSERTDLVATDTPETTNQNTPMVKMRDDLACYRVGPILDRDMLRQVRAIFEKSGFDVKVVSMNSSSAKYLVYIPPLASAEKAQLVLAELQKSGVDGNVVTETQLANAISLGTVSSLDKAEALKSRLGALGYRVESQSTFSAHDEQWLLLTNVGSVAKTQIDRIITGSPQIRRETASCP